MRNLILFICSVLVTNLAYAKDLDCSNYEVPIFEQINSLMMIKNKVETEDICPPPSELRLQGFCKAIREKIPYTGQRFADDPIQGFTHTPTGHRLYESVMDKYLDKLSCVDQTKDTVEEATRKINKMWPILLKTVHCEGISFFRYALNPEHMPLQMLNFVTDYQSLPLDDIDPKDGSSSRDYIRSLLEKDPDNRKLNAIDRNLKERGVE